MAIIQHNPNLVMSYCLNNTIRKLNSFLVMNLIVIKYENPEEFQEIDCLERIFKTYDCGASFFSLKQKFTDYSIALLIFVQNTLPCPSLQISDHTAMQALSYLQ